MEARLARLLPLRWLASWDEVKRFENPHKYYVDLSWNLWTLKRDLLAAAKK